MARSLKKGPFIDEKLWQKVSKAKKEASSKMILTWSRDSDIFPEMVGLTIGVYNGRQHIPVKIVEEMVGHKLGEFAPTRKFIKHGGRMAREEELEEKRKIPGREYKPVAEKEKEVSTTTIKEPSAHRVGPPAQPPARSTGEK